MPLVTIEVAETVSVEKRSAYADAVHEGLVKGLGLDAEDRFQVIHSLITENTLEDWYPGARGAR